MLPLTNTTVLLLPSCFSSRCCRAARKWHKGGAALPCNDAAATWFNGAENAGGWAGRRGVPLSGVETLLACHSRQLVADVREKEQETKGRETERERERVSNSVCRVRNYRGVTLCRRQLWAKSSGVHSCVATLLRIPEGLCASKSFFLSRLCWEMV